MPKHPTKLPAQTTLRVRFAGKDYPAWIERWSRRVFTVAGPVAKSVGVHVVLDRPVARFRQQDFAVRLKLERWGYQTRFEEGAKP
jgi:hypothetical protein